MATTWKTLTSDGVARNHGSWDSLLRYARENPGLHGKVYKRLRLEKQYWCNLRGSEVD